MRDVDRAIADIDSIRSQLAAGSQFRGYGPWVVAATGGLGAATAMAQSLWPETLAGHPWTYLAVWISTAVLGAGMVGAEMWRRVRLHHRGLADAMAANALEQLLPSAAAGAAIMAVILRYAPEEVWMLPGLWQILVALAAFASVRSLPRVLALVGVWYFLAGVATLIIASHDRTLSPWLMGAPFAIGQLLMAVLLHLTSEERHDEEA